MGTLKNNKYDLLLNNRIKHDVLLILGDAGIKCTLSKSNEISANIQATIPGKFSDRMSFQKKIQKCLKAAFKDNIDFSNLDMTNANLRLVLENEYRAREKNKETPAMTFVKELQQKMEKECATLDKKEEAAAKKKEEKKATPAPIIPIPVAPLSGKPTQVATVPLTYKPGPAIVSATTTVSVAFKIDFYDPEIISEIYRGLIGILNAKYKSKLPEASSQTVAVGDAMMLYKVIPLTLFPRTIVRPSLERTLSECSLDIFFVITTGKDEQIIFDLTNEYIKRIQSN